MTEEQKSQLNELLEALKKSDKNSIELFNDGVITGVESVQYEKGDDYLEYHRNFEYYSQTLKVDAPNKELIDIINDSLEDEDYSFFFESFNELGYDEILHSDDYEFNNYELNNCSLDDDEIPAEILDDNGEIDVLKLEDNGWSFEIMDQEEEDSEIDISRILIQIDDKKYTFTSD